MFSQISVDSPVPAIVIAQCWSGSGRNQFRQDRDAWDLLYKDRSAYQAVKSRIGREVLKNLEQRFPRMKGKLELLDVVSPKTYERYCNAYRGSFMPFMMTPEGKILDRPGTVRGISNLPLSGQRLQPPGGLPVAALTGKDTVMRICRRERQPFR